LSCWRKRRRKEKRGDKGGNVLEKIASRNGATEEGRHMKIEEIIEWFMREHSDWVDDKSLVSWARRLGIELNRNGMLDEDGLFSLFVLASLWNNKPTFHAETGERVFREIKDEYTLRNFREASHNRRTKNQLMTLADKTIGNRGIFNLLDFIAGEDNWELIKWVLTFPKIGDRQSDLKRLKKLWALLNNPSRGAYLKVNLFLIFREIRIQFRKTDRYQYHPAICCVPDSHVRMALADLGLIENPNRHDIESLITFSEIVAEHFCRKPYELYDLPLFLWHKTGQMKP